MVQCAVANTVRSSGLNIGDSLLGGGVNGEIGMTLSVHQPTHSSRMERDVSSFV